MFSFKVFLSCAILLTVVEYASADCEVDPFSTAAPLLISATTNTIIYPNHGEQTVKFHTGETVQFACPQRSILVDGTAIQSIVEATCISDAGFRVLGESFVWSQVVCNRNPVAVGRHLDANCGTNARLAEIGFDLGNGQFLRTITVCFDTTTQLALYTYFDLTASIGSAATGTARPAFSQDVGFYNVGANTLNRLYTIVNQRATINGLLGLEADSTKYITASQFMSLNKGHLVARTDFVYPAQQNATFRYINAAPQWGHFNNGNWNNAERSTRNYANLRNVDLQVWTGTYGVTTLPHETSGKDIPLYIYVDDNERALPVPAIFWKIVYEPVTRKGVVLIGVNNIYETNISKYVICPDVSSQLSWLSWRKENIALGYLYACTIGDFRKVVVYAPNLVVSGLLV